MPTRTVQVNVIGDTSNAERALAKVATAGEGSAGKLHSAFSGALGQVSGLFGGLESQVGRFGASLDKVGGAGGSGVSGALLGIAGGVAAVGVALGVKGVEAAASYEKAHVQLEQSIKDSGSTFEAHKAQIEGLDSSFRKFGYTQEQTEGALSHFVTGTQDTDKSLRLMGLAADIAKARNIDLTSATDLVTKASEGNLRALKQMGIDLPVTAGNALKLQQAQDAVAKAQEGVNKATAQGAVDGPKHAAAVRAQEAAQIALQTAEKRLADDRVRHATPTQIRIDTEHLTVAQQDLAAKMAAAQTPAAGLSAAQDRLTAAQKKLNDEQQSGTQVLDALSQRFGGQASAAADTFGGKIDAAKANYHDLLVQLGQKVEPVLTHVLDFLVNKGIPAAQSKLGEFETSWHNLMNNFGQTNLGKFEHDVGLDTVIWSMGDRFISGLHRLESAWGPFLSRFESGVGRFKDGWDRLFGGGGHGHGALGGVGNVLDTVGHGAVGVGNFVNSVAWNPGPSQPAPITLQVTGGDDVSKAIARSLTVVGGHAPS